MFLFFDTVAYWLFAPVESFLFDDGGFDARFASLPKTTSFVGEIRNILCAYFNYPYPRGKDSKRRHRCGFCEGKALFWCVECNHRFCADCVGRRHHPGTYSALHSIEEIIQADERGVRLMTPILGEAMLLTSLTLLWKSRWNFTPEYLVNFDICPVVDVTREWLAFVDTKIVYYWKDFFAANCGIEDSFYKLFLDGWVRNVITNTDDTLLVLSTLAPALLVRTVLTHAVVPALSAIHAVLLTVLRAVERRIPRTHFFLRLAHLVHYLDAVKIFQGRGIYPPRTHWRVRPGRDPLEQLVYANGRMMRRLRFFYFSMQEDLEYIVGGAVFYMVAFRLFCIWTQNLLGLQVGSVVREVLSCCGFGETIARQRDWFHRKASSFLNDRLLLPYLMRCLRLFTRMLHRVLGNSAGMCLLLVSPFVVLGLMIEWLVRERRKFKEHWSEEQPLWIGSCSTEGCCTCGACKFWRGLAAASEAASAAAAAEEEAASVSVGGERPPLKWSAERRHSVIELNEDGAVATATGAATAEEAGAKTSFPGVLADAAFTAGRGRFVLSGPMLQEAQGIVGVVAGHHPSSLDFSRLLNAAHCVDLKTGVAVKFGASHQPFCHGPVQGKHLEVEVVFSEVLSRKQNEDDSLVGKATGALGVGVVATADAGTMNKPRTATAAAPTGAAAATAPATEVNTSTASTASVYLRLDGRALGDGRPVFTGLPGPVYPAMLVHTRRQFFKGLRISWTKDEDSAELHATSSGTTGAVTPSLAAVARPAPAITTVRAVDRSAGAVAPVGAAARAKAAAPAPADAAGASDLGKAADAMWTSTAEAVFASATSEGPVASYSARLTRRAAAHFGAGAAAEAQASDADDAAADSGADAAVDSGADAAADSGVAATAPVGVALAPRFHAVHAAAEAGYSSTATTCALDDESDDGSASFAYAGDVYNPPAVSVTDVTVAEAEVAIEEATAALMRRASAIGGPPSSAATSAAAAPCSAGGQRRAKLLARWIEEHGRTTPEEALAVARAFMAAGCDTPSDLADFQAEDWPAELQAKPELCRNLLAAAVGGSPTSN